MFQAVERCPFLPFLVFTAHTQELNPFDCPAVCGQLGNDFRLVHCAKRGLGWGRGGRSAGGLAVVVLAVAAV